MDLETNPFVAGGGVGGLGRGFFFWSFLAPTEIRHKCYK